ncbi:hypothetical protein BC793_110304 [Actinoplanes xinjiangensis]|uniref:Phage L5-like integrase N-terminal domain-containing protein n=1 Tax=Actinoplanes xinjiangensis TaxID=512350 RepID=A0A316FEV7_9ACTN|nr:hypothetical protein BC793_110304 [Actinoplanes xinjiangensis]GIF40753.1 hypothetical protein Axi01nite_50640 [Actinoplanes xinjiangensis]
MANQKRHRRFGNIRKLPSGRFQARYLGPDGITRNADHTFETEKLAAQWLTLVESEIIRGEWQAPEAGEVHLSGYGKEWIAHRKFQPRPRELRGPVPPAHRADPRPPLARRHQAADDPLLARQAAGWWHNRTAGCEVVFAAAGDPQYRGP